MESMLPDYWGLIRRAAFAALGGILIVLVYHEVAIEILTDLVLLFLSWVFQWGEGPF